MIEEAENDLGDGAAILLLKLDDSLGDLQVARSEVGVILDARFALCGVDVEGYRRAAGS
mgnify:CR=1 FL=1